MCWSTARMTTGPATSTWWTSSAALWCGLPVLDLTQPLSRRHVHFHVCVCNLQTSAAAHTTSQRQRARMRPSCAALCAALIDKSAS